MTPFPAHACPGEQKLAFFDRILSGVAHDICNYSQTILLIGECLQELWSEAAPLFSRFCTEHGRLSAGGLAPERMARELPFQLETVTRNAAKISTLFAGFTDFGRSPGAAQPVDLASTIRTAASLLSHPARKSGCPLTFVPPGELPRLPGRIQDFLVAIADLAFHLCDTATGMERGIRLSAFREPAGAHVVIELATTAAMLSPAAVVSLQETVAMEKGTEAAGLFPLSSARSVLIRYGGRLHLAGAADTGLRLQMFFPLPPR